MRLMRQAIVPLGIYVVSRALAAYFFYLASVQQAELTDHPFHYVYETVPASPGYWGVMANWDGQWYKSIAIEGYPNNLPLVSGDVARNEWAFYPTFPLLSRAVMWLTSMPFEVAASLVSVVAAGIAIVVIHRCLLNRGISRFAAGASVACLCAFPTAPVLQVAYTESVTLLLLVSTLNCLTSRRYLVYSILVVVISLTRPIALPLAVIAGVHVLIRLRQEAGLPSARRAASFIGVVALPGFSTLLWPGIAWAVTGEKNAFFLTQEAWRLSSHASFFQASTLWQALESKVLFVGVFLLLTTLFLVVARRPARLWGTEMRVWAVTYPLYILAATQPTPSIFRYLLLALVPWWPFPEAGADDRESMPARILRWTLLVILVAAGFIAQYFWITEVFTVDQGPEHQTFP